MADKLKRQVVVDADGVALNGVDPVSFFGAVGPQKGNPSITENHAGAIWRFVDEANRAAFLDDPEKYMPQFGGHCTFGASRNQAFPGNPTTAKVIDGSVYLSLNRFVGSLMGPTPARIAKATKAWTTAT